MSKGVIWSLRYAHKKTREHFAKIIKNGDISQLFSNRFCAIMGYIPIIRYIFENRSYTSYLEEMKYTLQSEWSIKTHRDYLAMGRILKSVLIPSEKVQQTMHSLSPNYQDEEYIAVHLRVGGVQSDAKFFVEFFDLNNLTTAMKCIRDKSDTIKNIYMSSDSMKAKQQTSEIMKSYKIQYNSKRVDMVDTQSGIASDYLDQLYVAVAELWLLGSSSKCFGTKDSTFTFVGCSLSGKIPYILSPCEKLPTNQFSPYQL